MFLFRVSPVALPLPVRCRNCGETMPDIGIAAWDGARVCDSECAYRHWYYETVTRPQLNAMTKLCKLIDTKWKHALVRYG